jgi:hypothetical protein
MRRPAAACRTCAAKIESHAKSAAKKGNLLVAEQAFGMVLQASPGDLIGGPASIDVGETSGRI